MVGRRIDSLLLRLDAGAPGAAGDVPGSIPGEVPGDASAPVQGEEPEGGPAMNFWDEFPWWLLLVVGVAGCGLSSGLEIGLYSLNRVRLHLLAHRGDANARILDRIVRQRAGAVHLATMLIVTNIMTNLATKPPRACCWRRRRA